MGPAIHSGKPQYEGEDTRVTSSKELNAWYLYGWAAEVFVVCGIGSFIPITLEQLARESGVLASDRTTPCKASLQTLNTSTLNNATSTPISHLADSNQCVIFFLGVEINTASFAMYTFSISVLIQSLLIISMSGAADHGRFRKTLLLTFAFVGAVATMLFLAVSTRVYPLAALLAIIGNVCCGASFVLLNSFLPLLVRHHPSLHPSPSTDDEHINSEANVSPDDEEDHPDLSTTASTSALLPTPKPTSNPTTLHLATRISSNGISIGYISSILIQLLSFLILKLTHGSTFSLRLVLLLVGAWWFLFTIPCAFLLRPRPGPPLRRTSVPGSKAYTWLAYTSHSWRSLGRTIARARRLKDVCLFLAAWFLLSDAIATVSGTAVLFAKTTLQMPPSSLALINVTVMISGTLGALLWHHLPLPPTRTILTCLALFELIPLYALLGYIPAVRQAGLGLNSPWEMYLLGAVYGLVLGGLSSHCRAVFGELVPKGFETTFYSLYAITDKGSSIFGPAIVGLITDATGEIRPGFLFLAFLIALPMPLMYFVDVERGKLDAEAMARELDG